MTIVSVVRLAVRFILLIGIVVTGFLGYPIFLIRSSDGINLVSGKIAWMQWMSRRFLWLLGCKVSVRGCIPSQGLIVCNHLGYVDILAIGFVCPAIFIAKSDVREWPIFGWLASLAGTLFVSRNTPTQVMNQISEITSLLAGAHPIVLFPEGTSSDGRQVLPFRSSLLQAPLTTGNPITSAAISYTMSDGADPGTSVAYWGEMTFFLHLLSLMTNHSFTAQLHFGQSHVPSQDRKQEAALLHSQVSTLLKT